MNPMIDCFGWGVVALCVVALLVELPRLARELERLEREYLDERLRRRGDDR